MLSDCRVRPASVELRHSRRGGSEPAAYRWSLPRVTYHEHESDQDDDVRERDNERRDTANSEPCGVKCEAAGGICLATRGHHGSSYARHPYERPPASLSSYVMASAHTGRRNDPSWPGALHPMAQTSAADGRNA